MGKELRRLPVKETDSCVAFSPDSKLLAGGLLSGDVLVWNAGSGEEVLQLCGHRGFPRALSFSSDGKLLATADEIHVRVWDTATGKRLRRFRELNSINT